MKIQILFLILLASFGGHTLCSQDLLTKKQQDIYAIKQMQGCYAVEFKYTETFSPEIDYEKAYDYHASALEYAKVIHESDDTIQLQHLLVINDSIIIKHWRQDWIYEADRSFVYEPGNQWRFYEIPPETTEGAWTQQVFQVDDSPRYSGTATWTHVDGTSSWYNKADSPLPRREYTKRNDYNIMKRGNRVTLLENGWLHEQDNDKVIRDTTLTDQVLVQEKGYNTYILQPEEKCQLAIDWWSKNQEKWQKVRKKWDYVYHKADQLVLKEKFEEKRLYEHLFDPRKQFNEELISELIDLYVQQGL